MLVVYVAVKGFDLPFRQLKNFTQNQSCSDGERGVQSFLRQRCTSDRQANNDSLTWLNVYKKEKYKKENVSQN